MYEVNEAFASVPLAWLAETGADPDRLNPEAARSRLVTRLAAQAHASWTTRLHHMRDNAICFGLQTMCEGSGMANATILELIDKSMLARAMPIAVAGR